MSYIIEEMFPDDVDMNIEEGKDTAVIGVGSTEQHGPHLLLGCDSFIARGLCEFTVEMCNGVYFPILSHTWVGGLTPWTGTIDISSDNMGDYLEEICLGIINMGFKKIIIVDCHGGGREMAFSVASRVFKKTGVQVFAVFISRLFEEFTDILNLWEHYGIDKTDSSAFEASMMMGGLLKADKTELLHKVDENTKESLNEFGERDPSVEPSSILKNMLVGHLYLDETVHVAPRANADAKAGYEVLKAMGKKLAEIIKQFDGEEVREER